MDIWGWVSAKKKELRNAGEDRLASLMTSLPSLVCDNEHARVEALVPEALGLARAAKLPWVEVFVRHWLLQSRVFHRHEVGRSRHEAVSLLEFASREDTQGCPQSVCVTQDLAGCFARVDGPGYVQERLQVARESLGRIDPGWPCYACISSEYADALIDGGELEEALLFIRAQVAKAAAQGEFLEEEFALSEAHALILLHRYEEAVTRLDGHHHPAGGESHLLETRLMRAWALVGLERYEEAAQERPSFAAIRPTADHYESWVMATMGLVRGEVIANDVELGCQLRELYHQLEANGALWGAAQTAIVALELAWGRGAVEIAGLVRDDAQRLCAELRRPPKLPKPTQPKELKGPESAPAPVSADDPATLLAELPEDPERALDQLGAARERSPDDPKLAAAWAQVLRSVGFPERGLRDLELFAAGHPANGETLLELCRLHLACGDSAAIVELTRDRLRAFPELYPTGLWLLAQAEEKAGMIDAAIVTLRALIDLAPAADLPLVRLADLLRGQRRYAEALAFRRQLVERLEPGSNDWDLMTEATISEEWALVRRSAARLGIPAQPEGEGPIDGSYGLCRISLAADELHSGARKGLLWAERRGPVTARIIQVTGPGGREYYDDLFVFDAANIDEPEDRSGSSEDDEDDDEDNPRNHPVFRSVELLQRGDMVSYSLDGPHPGETILAGLRELFGDYGGRLWVCSGDNYRLRDREDAKGGSEGPKLLGIYAYAAVRRGVSPRELYEKLTELLASATRPLASVELAQALDPGPERDAAIERQAALVARFGL